MPAWADVLQEKSFNQTKKGLVFWPKSCLDRHKVEYKDDELAPFKGQPEAGLFRDAFHGTPTGCVETDETFSLKFQKGERLADSLATGSAEAVNRSWKDMSAASLNIVATRDKDNDVETLGQDVANPMGQPGQEDGEDSCSDSWDAVLPDMFQQDEKRRALPHGRRRGRKSFARNRRSCTANPGTV